MKRYFYLLTALLAVAQMSAQSIDTVRVIDQPDRVVITQTSNGVRVNVVDSVSNYSFTVNRESDDWELNFPYNLTFTKDTLSHWSIISNGFYMGGGIHHSWDMINNSFEIGLLNIAAVNYSSHHGQDISLGIGIHHRSYSLKRPNMLMYDENTGVVGTTFYPDGIDVNDRSSNLNVWTWQFPLLFRQRIYKSFAIRLGGIMNWNYKAKVHNKYTIGKTNYDVTHNGLKQNKITFDLMFGLSLKHTGIYCRYSPNELFKKGYGPEIKNTWTMGGIIAF